MAEAKHKGRPKLTLKDIREQHGTEVDITDPQQRSRYRRTLDNLYACGLKLEESEISDVARGTARTAASDYADRTGGKAITPIEQTTTILHKSIDESAASILEMLGQKRKESQQAQQVTKPATIQ